MKTSESIKEISKAILKAQKEMVSPKKTANNPFFKSKYSDLNSVREACIPALNENGITLLQPIVQSDGKNYVQTLLLHESGEFLSSLTEIVCAKQNDPQAMGSGISYSRRYGLMALLGMAADDDDAEGAMERKPVQPKTSVLDLPAKQINTIPTQIGDAPTFSKRKASAPKSEVKSDEEEKGW